MLKNIIFFLLFCTLSCTPLIKQEGQFLMEEDISSVVLHVHKTKDIQELLGSPSTISQFSNDGKKWYYVGQKMRHNFFSMPQPIDRQVVVLTFDKNNIVQNIEKFGLEKGQDIEMVGRATPNLGQETGFFEDLFGNLGSFGPALKDMGE